MFEYQKQVEESEQNNEIGLIHKTTDGFYGYNTADIKDCALVSSFNGLLITGDDLGESGVGYWSNNYGDYRQSYKSAKNPENKIKVPKEFKTKYVKSLSPQTVATLYVLTHLIPAASNNLNP